VLLLSLNCTLIKITATMDRARSISRGTRSQRNTLYINVRYENKRAMAEQWQKCRFAGRQAAADFPARLQVRARREKRAGYSAFFLVQMLRKSLRVSTMNVVRARRRLLAFQLAGWLPSISISPTKGAPAAD
jgi:hypothetical protein